MEDAWSVSSSFRLRWFFFGLGSDLGRSAPVGTRIVSSSTLHRPFSQPFDFFQIGQIEQDQLLGQLWSSLLFRFRRLPPEGKWVTRRSLSLKSMTRGFQRRRIHFDPMLVQKFQAKEAQRYAEIAAQMVYDTICAKMITEMRGADLIAFRIN